LAPIGFFTSRIELNAALAVILPLAVATKAWTAGPIVRVESEKNDAFRVASPYPQPDSAIIRTQGRDQACSRPGISRARRGQPHISRRARLVAFQFGSLISHNLPRVLILPIEFSRCPKLADAAGGTPACSALICY